MSRKRKLFAIAVAALVLLVGWLMLTNSGQRMQFILGGAMINLGYRMQDHHES